MRVLQLHLLLGAAGVALAVPTGAQSTFWVSAGTCPEMGTGSRSDPFCRIQSAIDISEFGDTILVLPGKYEESISFLGRDVTVRSLAGPSVTQIEGRGQEDTVLFVKGEGSGAVLDGFTITNRSSRRGIQCVGSSPVIKNNVITNHYTPNLGAGIYLSGGADATILGNVISNNQSIPGVGAGGGIYCAQSSPLIQGNIIDGNSTWSDPGGRGAGIYLASSNALLVGNLIINNTSCDYAFNTGGGVQVSGGSATIANCTFSGNVSCTGGFGYPVGGEGGALHVASGAMVTISDSILWSNLGGDGQEIYASNASVVVQNSNIAQEPGDISGGDLVQLGANTLGVDPQFIGGGDFHLSSNSPLIDAGSAGTVGGTDGDGEPRTLDGDLDLEQRVDMGWDEFDPTGLSVAGSPSLGTTLTFSTTAPAGWVYRLLMALSQDEVPAAPFGSLLLGQQGRRRLGGGAVPGTDLLTIPAQSSLLGIDFYVQALAHGASPGSPGSFSRRLALRVQ